MSEAVITEKPFVAPRASLFKALSKAQGDFKDIPKTKTAGAGGKFSYSYADLADIRKTIQPTLSKNGLCVIQSIQGDALVTELGHESGESIKSYMHLTYPQDPQKLGSLLTYYRRYQLCAILNIAADEDDDGQAAKTPSRRETPASTQTKSQSQIPNYAAKHQPQQSGDPGDWTFRFGKFKGKALKDLPIDEVDGYHSWLSKQKDPNPETMNAIKTYIDSKTGGSSFDPDETIPL